jgi:crossover junction endodeoxyribonuclease RuvC
MIILGIDPGTATSGYGLLRINGESTPIAMKYGLIETPKDSSPARRLHSIYTQFEYVFSKYSPDIVAIEKVFFASNAKTAIRVGQAQGVMLLTAAEAHVPVFEYSPMTIKKLVAGHGRADKLAVQQSVRRYLGQSVRSKKGKKTHFDDSADALAVALCHSIAENLIQAYEEILKKG